MTRSFPLLLAIALGAWGAIALGADREAEIERDFRKLEKRLDGSDASIRDACGTTARVTLEDRPGESAHALIERVTDVEATGTSREALLPCVRGIARAGIVEGWTLAPATTGSAAAWTARIKLHRARRDPNASAGARRTEAADAESATRLTALWRSRSPRLEAAAPELIAPDLVSLSEARWNAGNVIVEGTAEDERYLDLFRGIVASLGTGFHPEFHLDLVRPDDAARFAVEPPTVPKDGTLRVAFRHAPPGTVLRALAELDRRDFVVPALPARDGALGGGWNGIAQKFATDASLAPVHVGAIDVFAPAGTVEPASIHRDGAKVSLDLERVEPALLAELLATAGRTPIDVPRGLKALDVHLVRVPWTQALDAVALASGCRVAIAPDRRTLSCPASDAAAARAPTPAAAAASDERAPLERSAVSRLRVAVLATRDDSRRWIAAVETPEGVHVTTRTGTALGLEPAHAVVDEHGVAAVFDARAGAPAVRIPF
ncbi:MAG TPA: hypothetical protein VMV18_01655 [bacterium]|nr:hypothetical protein [bacterium]